MPLGGVVRCEDIGSRNINFQKLDVSGSDSKSADFQIVYYMHWNAVVRFVLECEHIFHLFWNC